MCLYLSPACADSDSPPKAPNSAPMMPPCTKFKAPSTAQIVMAMPRVGGSRTYHTEGERENQVRDCFVDLLYRYPTRESRDQGTLCVAVCMSVPRLGVQGGVAVPGAMAVPQWRLQGSVVVAVLVAARLALHKAHQQEDVITPAPHTQTGDEIRTP
jgi:hypothetical protein